MLVGKSEFLLLILFISATGPKISDAANTLTSIPESTNGTVTVCPGDFLSFTCTHDNTASQQTLWFLPDVTTSCVVPHDEGVTPLPNCSPFTITMISGRSGPTLTSTVQMTVTDSLAGTFLVECFAGGLASSPQAGNVTLNVPSIPIPDIMSVEQISQSTVEVNLMVTESTCAGSFVVNANQDGGSEVISASSSTSLVSVSGLDLCRYNYSFVVYTVTPNGVLGNMTSPVSFTANLTVVLGVENVRTNQELTALEWDQQVNANYSSCITNYSIQWDGVNYDTDNIVFSVSGEQLQGFPFCQITSVTVTPLTPMGPLTGVSDTANISLIDPDFAPPIISGAYTQNTTTGVNATNGNDTMNVTQPEMIVFMGTVQSLSIISVPVRMFGVSRAGMMCTPNIMFTGNTFEAVLPNNISHGDVGTICVEFRNNDCMETTAENFTIPGRNITSTSGGGKSSFRNFTDTLDLSISAYLPEDLLIIISLSPDDVAPVTVDFPSSYQYTLTFTGLTPGVNYRYTVQIVLRDNMAFEVASTVGLFSTTSLPTLPPTQPPDSTTMPSITTRPTTPTGVPQGGCDMTCIIVVVVVVVVIIILVIVVIVGIIACHKYHNTGKVDFKKSGEVEMDQHTLTAASTGAEDSKSSGLDSPTSDKFKSSEARDQSPTPDDSKTDSKTHQTDGAGATGSENLIYADLDLHTKGKKHKPQDAPSPTGGTGKEEEVQYATISSAVDKKEES